MTEMISISKEAFTSMEKRLKLLAKEKSNLQLITHLIDQLSTAPGLEATIENMLMILLSNIGGINIMIYYMIDHKYHYADTFGKKAQFDSIDDPLVKKVFETGKSMEHEHDFSDTRMMTAEFTKAYTWVFPLQVGKDMIGVLKMENMQISVSELQEHLQTFFNYVALLLKNEILGYTSLSRAYDLLHQTSIELKESEKKYRSVFETTGSATIIIEEDMTISMVNAEYCRIFGCSKEEIEGKKKIIEFVYKDDQKIIMKNHRLRRANLDMAPINYEFRAVDIQGRLLDVYITIAMIPGTMKSVASILDITKRKQADKELHEANEKLAGSVKKLEIWNSEISLLNEMGELLQGAQCLDEIYALSAQFNQRIFPDMQGALCLVCPSNNLVEEVIRWGESVFSERFFEKSDCRALRSRRPHLVIEPFGNEMLCNHITNPHIAICYCVPMITQGEAMGLLHLHRMSIKNEDVSFFIEHQQHLAEEVSNYIALAVTNLKLREILRQQSIIDPLTGLYNRRYMEENLVRELSRAERKKGPVGLIMFDIDHFKEFNDTFGHGGGDALLHALGDFLVKHTREGDIVSRYGGDEFVFVLPEATLEDSRQRAEELRQNVKELQISYWDKQLSKCTLSLGVAAFPEHGLTCDALLKSADIALYRAKNEGKDRVAVAST
ncbi:diguanylate cyclase [Acetobacterium sp.]|uniref:diguanylate cyclase n=1 Tax=Acetobacterium sp. TaxID=1872094 RepID=UPI002F420E98